jgi:hypothetical protein
LTETSGFWTTDDTTPAGHQVASYTQVIAAKAWAILASCGGKEGVAPSYLNELVGSVPAAKKARIGTGGAVVDGQWYENNAAVDLDIGEAVGEGNTRIDRIVLKCTWADFDVVLEVIPGTDAASPVAPSLTQTPGTEYDIPLYQALVNVGGTVTLTDERTWAIVDVDDSTIEASAGELRVKDLGITLAKLAADSVDDTKAGNRVPQFYRRQGGSATVWSTAGTTDYTPGAVRMQGGSIDLVANTANDTVDVTFPVAFSYAPEVILSCGSASTLGAGVSFSLHAHSITTTGFTVAIFTNTYGPTTYRIHWLAIGPE